MIIIIIIIITFIRLNSHLPSVSFFPRFITHSAAEPLVTMSVLVTLGWKCTPAALRAAPW